MNLYLEHRCELKLEEDRHEDVSGHRYEKDVADPDHPVLGPVHVNLSRCPQQGDGCREKKT